MYRVVRGAPLLRGAIIGNAASTLGGQHATGKIAGQDLRAPDPSGFSSTPVGVNPGAPDTAPIDNRFAGGAGETVSLLAKLGEMRQAGLLTAEEFDAAKAKVLNS